MLPPLQMLAKKNRAGESWTFFLALTLLLAGCTPPGPRALLDGKRLLEQGDYAQAVEKLRLATSTTLLATNAQAWNYLGLACHHAGQATDAAQAYAQALRFNRDLAEAHFNLGCLWLDQGKTSNAEAELTIFTQLRPNAPEGWLKLGMVCLGLRDLASATNSFNAVLRLSPRNPEALNGLGLAQLQRNRPRDAAPYFAAALKQRPDYRPALLNLAVVSQQYLNDRQTALQKYREYLALKPQPADWAAVNAVAQALEQQLAAPPRPAQTNAAAKSAANTNTAKAQNATITRTNAPAKTEPAANVVKAAPAVPQTDNLEVVKLPPEPVVRTTPASSTPSVPPQTAATPPAAIESAPAAAATSAAEAPKTAKRSFFQRLNPVNLFRSAPKPAPRPTPLPAQSVKNQPALSLAVSSSPVTASSATATADTSRGVVPSPSQSYPRYTYLSPPKPPEGNRRDAERVFAQGEQAQNANRLAEAAQAFRQAAQLDPSYFEAYYALGLVSFQLRSYRQALAACESALAIRPDSVDARYNFALVLKAANFPVDAATELERILAANPNETRAHLALGNLCAQQLRQPDKAREHYLKVLELDPRHPAAADIRFWLVANPP